jgi:hypothetical protein
LPIELGFGKAAFGVIGKLLVPAFEPAKPAT